MSETSPEEFGAWVAARRADLKVSQGRLAEVAGVAVGTIKAVEHGKSVRQSSKTRISRGLAKIEKAETDLGGAWLREQIAAEIEAMADHYPTDIFPEDSWSPDAVGARAMRHAYRMAARIARGEDWRES